MFVYKITNLVNSRIYVGKTEKTISDRWKRHIKCVGKKNHPLYDSMNKHGINNFIIEEIDRASDSYELNEKEKFWIAELKAEVKFGNYNLTSGGNGGDTLKYNPNRDQIYKDQALKRVGKKRSSDARVNMSLAARKREANKTEDEKTEHSLKVSETLKRKYASGELVPNTPKLYGSDNPNWVEVNKEVILHFIKEGKTLKNIANFYNTSTTTIGTKVKKLFNKTYSEIAKEHNAKRKIKYPNSRRSRSRCN